MPSTPLKLFRTVVVTPTGVSDLVMTQSQLDQFIRGTAYAHGDAGRVETFPGWGHNVWPRAVVMNYPLARRTE